MLNLNYDYAACIRQAEKVCWTVDQVMPSDARLDFSRPFLPEALAGSGHVAGLSDADRLTLNHITGNAYINLFAFVEEFIIATAVVHAQAEMHGDHHAVRALVRFAEEELKHQELFNRFLDVFQQSFGHTCGVLGDAATAAGAVMSKRPMAVMLVTIHLEIMTQAHYVESVKDNERLDPLFVSLLKHHWLEEAQHAKIDALELDKLAEDATPELITKAFHEYMELVDALDELLASQARMDVESLASASGATFQEADAAAIAAAQHAAYRRTFLVMGMKNRMFVDILAALSPECAARVAEKAALLS